MMSPCGERRAESCTNGPTLMDERSTLCGAVRLCACSCTPSPSLGAWRRSTRTCRLRGTKRGCVASACSTSSALRTLRAATTSRSCASTTPTSCCTTSSSSTSSSRSRRHAATRTHAARHAWEHTSTHASHVRLALACEPSPRSARQVYLREGVEFKQVDYQDNGPILELIAKWPTCLMGLLDDACKTGSGSDEKVITAFHEVRDEIELHHPWPHHHVLTIPRPRSSSGRHSVVPRAA
jgi:hypothetical protein